MLCKRHFTIVFKECGSSLLADCKSVLYFFYLLCFSENVCSDITVETRS